MKRLLSVFVVCLPWPLKRWLLRTLWRYEIHATAHIGLAWVFPEHLSMRPHSRIGHLTVCKGMKLLRLEEYALIGRGNWISGFPKVASRHFAHQPDREPGLTIGRHAAITNRHLIDCTATVTVGAFATMAGFGSQILTHTIDLEHNCQTSAPVRIGAYSFVGTNCVILGGSVLPDYSVLGAKALLNQALDQPYQLYAGVPARSVKQLSPDWKYFQRTEGFVY
jgi:acetyltransferase-like isoleucine patch superfamily enzyme